MATKQDREEARERLLKILEPGDKVYCILRHVSRSGMSRWIDLYAIKADEQGGEPIKHWLSYSAAALGAGDSFDQARKCVKVSGCGMDMGFALVHNLGRLLWPEGGPVEKSQRRHQEEREGNRVETDGGYLLRHEWM